MKKLVLITLSCICVLGCDYTVQLVDTPNIDIDQSLVGLWERKGDNGYQKLLILPMGAKEYIVSFPYGGSDAMFARACLVKNSDITMAQLNWLGTAQATLPDDNRTFQYVSYEISDDRLTVRLLNTDLVPKQLNSSKLFIDSIETNKDNPELFHNKMIFKKNIENNKDRYSTHK